MSPMMKALGIDQLSVDERIALAEEIWKSVVQDVEGAPMTPAQRTEIERRLGDSIARPDAVVPWEEVLANALTRARK